MPRPRARSLFELGGYWIAEEPGREGLYCFWNDEGTGRTRRRSLGTGDIGDAKKRLAEIVVNGLPADNDSYLSNVLKTYFVERTDHLPSGKPARHAGKLFLRCWGEKTKAGDIGTGKLKDFADWSILQKHSVNYIARNFSVLAAALAHAKLPHDIPIKEGAILDRWPDLVAKNKPKRKVYEPTDEDLARLFQRDLGPSIRLWLLNSMATLGRPMAVAQLKPAQRDRVHQLIALNPEGRRQNKKFRPTVRELVVQTKWLDEAEKPKKGPPMASTRQYSLYFNRSSIKTRLAYHCAEERANIPSMALYGIRHRGTTVLRNAKVPREQIDFQLGHIPKGSSRTTHDYGQYEPGYLSEAAAALEAWIERVLKLAAQKDRAKEKRAA